MRAFAIVWLFVLAILLALLALGAAVSRADSYDPVIRFQCVPRAYCGVWGGPLAQQCAYPVVAYYCEREHASGTVIWWWRRQ